MYGADYDDSFPLSHRYEPSYTALFGLATWQTEVQPYVKNWGVMLHPKNSSLPSDAALAAWQRNLHYGVFCKSAVETPGSSNYVSFASGFTTAVSGGNTVWYEGFFGIGCEGTTCPWTNSAGPSVPSMSQTQVDNISGSLLAAEGGMWDLWTGSINLGNHPLAYGVLWSPAVYNLNGSSTYVMAGPHARKAPIQGRNGLSLAICNGMTTYVRTDGSAKAVPYRGGMMQNAFLSNGTRVLRNLYPAGGF
jgi:hypothetical protein